jgi:hypothetical protein
METPKGVSHKREREREPANFVRHPLMSRAA